MFKYARADTHFLLYIYDRMRNDLLAKSNPTTHNLLHATLQRSSETALKKHEKEIYDAEEGEGPNGWRNMYTKWNRSLNNQQFTVFKALHAWRDQMARDEDESLRYVLPNHMLFTLAEKMPTESTGVLGCCNPVPPPVRMNASDMAMLIARVKLTVPTTVGGFHKVEIKEPVHVRFDASTGLQPTNEGALEESGSTEAPVPTVASTPAKGGKVLSAASSGMFGKESASGSAPKPLVAPAALFAKRSGMFGDVQVSKPNHGAEDAKAKAQRIMMELSAQPAVAVPVFKEINSVLEAPIESAKRTEPPTVVEEEAPVAKKSRTDVLVLGSMSKQRARALDEDRAELEVVSISSGTEDDQEEEAVSTKKSKNKKKKSSLAQSSTPTSTTNEIPEAFQPFDYSTVSSVVDETMNANSKRKSKKKVVAPDASEIAKRKLKGLSENIKILDVCDKTRLVYLNSSLGR